MYTVTAHIHRDHLPNRATTRPVRVNTAREDSMGARNHRMGHADARVRCGGDFRLAPGQPAARLCTRWQPRRKMARKRIALSARD